MENLVDSIIFLGAFLCLCYFILIASHCYGWLRTSYYVSVTPDHSFFISVVIAARNEEVAIVNCLQVILQQSYPADKFEVIIVDDHSEDKTKEVIEGFCHQFSNIRLLALSENKTGKKQAMSLAIEAAKGDLIVTTDADCVMGSQWLSVIASFYASTGAEMIVSPVAFHRERTVFEKMQSLEFMALMASGGAALYYNKAIMCNGANLAYTKKAYQGVNGFDGIDGKASGDDVLLMYKINNKQPGAIRFLKNEQAIVYTEAKQRVGAFIQQRKRWASKGFVALNTETKLTALIVYFFNAFLVLVPLIDLLVYRNSVFHLLLTEFCLILIGIKCIIDFLLLFLSASFFKKERFLLLFLPEQILYMMYVLLIGLFGSLGKYEWKGRKTN